MASAGRERRRPVARDDRALIRWTLGAALVVGGLFLAAAAFRASAAGVSPIDHLGPVAAMGVIGFTIGGLLGPLLMGIAGRARRR